MTLAAPVSEQQSSTSLEDDAVEWLLSVPGVLIPLPLFDYMRLEWTPLAIKPDVQMFCVGTPSEEERILQPALRDTNTSVTYQLRGAIRERDSEDAICHLWINRTTLGNTISYQFFNDLPYKSNALNSSDTLAATSWPSVASTTTPRPSSRRKDPAPSSTPSCDQYPSSQSSCSGNSSSSSSNSRPLASNVSQLGPPPGSSFPTSRPKHFRPFNREEQIGLAIGLSVGLPSLVVAILAWRFPRIPHEISPLSAPPVSAATRTIVIV